MQVRIVNSPAFAPELDLGSRLKELLANRSYTKLTIVSAWVKRSGLRHIEADLRAFRARGGTVSMIAGIDEHGATRQGLELARALSDDVSIFHEPGGGTFHPKVYVIEGTRKAAAFVGSGNLTLGGLKDNLECSVELDLDLPVDVKELDQLRAWIDGLRNETEVCLALTDKLRAVLIKNGIAGDEDRRRVGKAADSVAKTPVLPFGKRSRARSRTTTGGRGASKRTATVTKSVSTGGPAIAGLVARWFKKLDASSAQQPPHGGTNVTGVLRLTRAGLAIDQTTYFRSSLFRSATWKPKAVGKLKGESATVRFDVTIGGEYLGSYPLQVTHAAHREANQGNVTTVLHWGPLSPTLRAKRFTGHWVVIDRAADGAFALRVEPHEPAPV